MIRHKSRFYGCFSVLAAGFALCKTAFAAPKAVPDRVITVRDTAQLRMALQNAAPNTQINVAPGDYQGGIFLQNVRGAAGKPIVVAGADPQNLPHFKGGGVGLQIAEAAYLELRDLQFSGARDNGISIDDGGTFDTPAHHITLRNLQISDIGPRGNHDGIKLSGVDDFRVEHCRIARWGTGSGSGIDMVGCHRGVIENNIFTHEKDANATGASAVQAKGGCREIFIRRNHFQNAGQRAVNLGGSTGMPFFRPPLDKWPAGEDKYEAKDIRVEGNTFVGSLAPLAFVGVDGGAVRFNTIYQPGRWAMRILQETNQPGFAPSRNGVFSDNIVVFRSAQWGEGGVNIGPNTQAPSFKFARNLWFCEDAPSRSRPALPAPETNGLYGTDPLFENAEANDLRLKPDSPARKAGAEAWPAVEKAEARR